MNIVRELVGSVIVAWMANLVFGRARTVMAADCLIVAKDYENTKMPKELTDPERVLMTKAVFAWQNFMQYKKGGTAAVIAEESWYRACEDLLKWKRKHGK